MKTFLDLVLLVLFGIVLFVALALTVNCAHLPPSPQTIPICLEADPGVYPGSCGDTVTDEGYQCAACDSRGCVTLDFVFCVAAGCDDPRCHPRKTSRK